MKIALIRREYITHLDGVNRFIAFLAEGFVKLGHSPLIASWCYREVERERLEEWFKEIHGLNGTIPIYTLRLKACRRGPWLRIAWDWYTKGSKLLHEEDVNVVIVNGIIPLKFRPRIAVNHGITLKPNKLYVFLAKKTV